MNATIGRYRVLLGCDAIKRLLTRCCSIPIAAIEGSAIGDAEAPPTVSALKGTASARQMSIFSAISMASSTSMPRYRTVLSIFECPSDWASYYASPISLKVKDLLRAVWC